MSSQYALIRDGLLEIVHKLSQMNMDGGDKRLDELSEKLTLEQFNLVVMGQFKRGKSTLINALLGAAPPLRATHPTTSASSSMTLRTELNRPHKPSKRSESESRTSRAPKSAYQSRRRAPPPEHL